MDVNISIDWAAIGQAVVNALVDGVRQLMSPIPQEFVQWLVEQFQTLLAFQGSLNFLTHIPVEWTSQNATVLSLWRAILPIQLGLTVIVLCFSGFSIMRHKADPFEVFGKLVIAIILGYGMAMWCDQIFGIVNLISDTVGTAPLDIRRESMPSSIVMALMLIIAMFLSFLAWIKGAVGVVFLDVLIVVAPAFLVLGVLPFFEGLVKWWFEEMTTWCLRPIMVALVLRLGLGIGSEQSGGVQLLLAIVSFWLAWSMDQRIRRFSVGAWGSVQQMGLFAKGAQMAAGVFSGGATTVAQGAAAAGAAAVGSAGSAASAYNQRLHS